MGRERCGNRNELRKVRCPGVWRAHSCLPVLSTSSRTLHGFPAWEASISHAPIATTYLSIAGLIPSRAQFNLCMLGSERPCSLPDDLLAGRIKNPAEVVDVHMIRSIWHRTQSNSLCRSARVLFAYTTRMGHRRFSITALFFTTGVFTLTSLISYNLGSISWC